MSKLNGSEVDVKSLSSSNPAILEIENGQVEVIGEFENENLDYIQRFDIDAHTEPVSDGLILKKVDRKFMVAMTITYTLQFLDKVVLNYAKVMGMTKDLHFKGNQFSALPTYFFVAYIFAEFVQGFYFIQKFPVAKVLAVNVFIWGVLSACCAATSNFAGMLVVRVLLGVSESSITPCLVLLTTNFYTRSEGAFRIGIWYSGLGLGQIFGGIISYLFQLVNASFEGWRIMFIVIGVLNMFAGIYVWFMIPSTPLTSNFLTAKEKYVLLVKLTDGKIGVNGTKFIWTQALELLFDIQAWLLLIICATISFSSNTISTFSATDIMSFGFTSKQAALLNMPSGVVSIASSLLSLYVIMKGTPRFLAIVLFMIPAVCGGALMSFLPKLSKGGLLVGIYMVNTVTAPLAICYSWAGANFAGSTKKIGSTAIFISIGFAIGNIVGPQSYRVADAPNYYPAKISMLITQCVSIGLAFLIWGIYFLRNKKRDREQKNMEISSEKEVEDVWNDLTDFQNRSFRYVY